MLTGVTTGTLAVVAGAVIATACPAQAASCAAPVRYVPTTNTIYLTGRGSYTPAQIVAACPTAPLGLVSPGTMTWLLSADLVLQQGTTLLLKGARAGGQVGNLRIRSLSSNKATEVQQITAGYGTIQIDSAEITSWDTSANAPDTNAKLPSGAAATARGRAFIRALSTLTPDGKTVQESRNRSQTGARRPSRMCAS